MDLLPDRVAAMIRTPRRGDTMLRSRDWVLIYMGVVAVPPVISGLVAGGLLPLGDAIGCPAIAVVGATGLVLVYSPVVTLFATPLALLILWGALRLGVAGWLVAIVVGTGLPGVILTAMTWPELSGLAHLPWSPPLSDPEMLARDTVRLIAMFAFAGTVHAATPWLCLRALCPEAVTCRTAVNQV